VFAAQLDAPAPGGYVVRVEPDGPGANPANPVAGCTLVWDPDG
jgi:hypothetical protein